jgi:hypothetical protein
VPWRQRWRRRPTSLPSSARTLHCVMPRPHLGPQKPRQNQLRSPVRVPPPREPVCLSQPYGSSQNGGTLIAEAVVDLAQHQRRLTEPHGYRPSACGCCSCTTLYVHDYRTRVCQLLAALVVMVVRYRCVGCGGHWQVLPAFIARHLWYNWPVVQQSCSRGTRK